MFDLGTQELIVIFIVAFLVFGPKRLPELGRTLGKGIRELKAAMRGIKDSIEEVSEDATEELKEAKTSIEESIFKSIESNINQQQQEEEKKEEKGSAPQSEETPVTAEGEDKEKKETDKDG